MRDDHLQLFDPRTTMTLEELTQVQSLARKHITFSLTLACPLTCAHCIVSAAPSKAATTMPQDAAVAYAEQFPELAEYGITGVSFTGGEPLLAGPQLKVLADAAEAAGLTTGVVTAAHWATTDKAARRTVERFRAIGVWDISVDAFHLDFVPFDTIRRAYEAVRAAGRQVTIRYSYQSPPSEADLDVLTLISDLEEASFVAQRVRPVGRGEAIVEEPGQTHNPWIKPCLTQGMVVRYDSSISPCCLNLVESREHPFQLGSARARPLREIHQAYMAMPLLQLIRALGFAQLRDWIVEAGLGGRLPDPIPDEACEVCALMMQDRVIRDFLLDKVNEPETRTRIALIASRTLGEDEPLQSLLRDLPADSEGPDADALELTRRLLDRERPAKAVADSFGGD